MTKRLKTKKTVKDNKKPVTKASRKVSKHPERTQAQKESLARMGTQLDRYGNVEFKKGEKENSLTTVEEDPLQVHLQLFETTGQYDANAASHLIQQAYKAQPNWSASWNVTSAFLHGIAPQDSLEGLLASQMTVAHSLSMECARRAMVEDQYPNAIDRYINHSAKLMKVFTAQMEALQKYRSKGQQQIVVKHQQVNVSEGGQAVVGDIHQGGGGNATKK